MRRKEDDRSQNPHPKQPQLLHKPVSSLAVKADVVRELLSRIEPTLLAVLVCRIILVLLRLGLSREVESSGVLEVTALLSSGTLAAKGKGRTAREAAAEGSSTAKSPSIAHHAEQDLGVDTSTHTSAIEHVGHVNQIVPIVVPSSLPNNLMLAAVVSLWREVTH